jgi:hypothetical protein
MKLILFFILLFIQCDLKAHSGGTNSSGCHNNRKSGGYHCHNTNVSKHYKSIINNSQTYKALPKSNESVISNSTLEANVWRFVHSQKSKEMEAFSYIQKSKVSDVYLKLISMPKFKCASIWLLEISSEFFKSNTKTINATVKFDRRPSRTVSLSVYNRAITPNFEYKLHDVLKKTKHSVVLDSLETELITLNEFIIRLDDLKSSPAYKFSLNKSSKVNAESIRRCKDSANYLIQD